jgi:hypothetical protein
VQEVEVVDKKTREEKVRKLLMMAMTKTIKELLNEGKAVVRSHK